jgi:hypothetical protein
MCCDRNRLSGTASTLRISTNPAAHTSRSQGFAIVFCFKGFPRNILKKSFLYASIWYVAVAIVNAVMFVLYHKSDTYWPRIFALATSGVVFTGFLCVALMPRLSALML